MYKKIVIYLGCFIALFVGSNVHAENKDVMPNHLAIMPVMIADDQAQYKSTTLIEWFRYHRSNKAEHQGALKKMIRNHVAFGLDDKGYHIFKNEQVDPLLKNYQGSELNANNPFLNSGIQILVFPKVLQVNTNRIQSHGELQLELQLDFVSTATGKLIWTGKNTNVRIWDQKNIVSPDLSHFLTKAIKNSLSKLPKMKEQA